MAQATATWPGARPVARRAATPRPGTPSGTLLTDAALGTGRRWFPGRAGAELALKLATPGRPPTG